MLESRMAPKRTAIVVTRLAAVWLILSFGYARAQNKEGAKPPGKMVLVGAHRLHLHCMGKGSPTVVMEAGAGDFSFVWSLVQPLVSEKTRVCAYDRAGYAWSEPGPRPRTLLQTAYELHTLLHNAGVKPPYLLVGASLGGLIARVYARSYPAEVAGIVFVDSSHENSYLSMRGKAVRLRDGSEKRQIPAVQTEARSRVLKSIPLIPLSDSKQLDPRDPRSKLAIHLQRVWFAAQKQEKYSQARESEFQYLPEELQKLFEEGKENRTPLGDKPVIVLARAQGYPSALEGMSQDQLNQERKQNQTELSQLSSNGRLVFTQDSGHEIHLYQPEIVAKAILEAVFAARESRPPPPN